jgi:hypothetical protein
MISRRKFIKESVAASAAITVGAGLGCSKTQAPSPYDAKGVPTAILGKTGVTVPRMVMGTGSRFCSVQEEEKGLEMLNYALDHGLYYWDTASSYGVDKVVSEERLGKVLKDRRQEVFLATKTRERNGEDARREIERSLKRLNTDHLDLLQIHTIQSLEDVEKIEKDDSVYKVISQLKDEGVVRFIGFTGHTDAAAMKAMTERFDFDTMLIALNHYKKGNQPFEEQAVPAAAEKGMGVIGMKVIRPRENNENLDPKKLIRYALTLEHIDTAVVGIDSMEVLKENIALLKRFEPLNQEEMEELNMALAPFYRHENLAWMQPGYQDGMPV